MLISAVLAPVAGIIDFGGFLFGFDVPFVMIRFGDWSAPAWLTFPVSLVLGALFFAAAYGLWRALRWYVRTVCRGNPRCGRCKRDNRGLSGIRIGGGTNSRRPFAL